MKADIIKAGILLMVSFMFILSLGGAGQVAMERWVVANCTKLQEQSEQFKGFYLTEIEANECLSKGFVIDAPVR